MQLTLHPSIVTMILGGGLVAAGCSERAGAPDAPGGRVVVSTAPLELAGVSDVVWSLRVEAGATPVWSATVRSSRYGDGQGSLSYVGACDASAGMNRVTVEILAIEDPAGEPLSDWRNPGPMSRDVLCQDNADAAVAFDVVVARAARQGFFDIAVDVEDVFCSAKVDCVDAEDQPLELLFDGAERGPTAVVAWACTTGPGTPSYLYMSDVRIECSDGTRLSSDPDAGPGNIGGVAPYLFQRAVYRTREQLPGLAKCAWVNAFGLDLDAFAAAAVDCRLSAEATVSAEPWPLGLSPDGVVRPVIAIDVPLVEDGALACSRHPLDGAPVGVATTYPAAGTHFAHTLECSPELVPHDNGFACGRASGGPYAMAQEGRDVTVRIGDRVSDPMPLPPGANLAGCCLDGCCAGN